MESRDAATLPVDQRSLLLKCPWSGVNPLYRYQVGLSEYAEFDEETVIALHKAMARNKSFTKHIRTKDLGRRIRSKFEDLGG